MNRSTEIFISGFKEDKDIFLKNTLACSIIYENEPMEKNSMSQKPHAFTNTFFSLKELATSITQGLIIAAGTLIIYQYGVRQGFSQATVRTMVFTVLITANIFLTLVNRSFYYSILTTVRYKNKLVLLIICITILITGLLLFVKPLSVFFQFEPPVFTNYPLVWQQVFYLLYGMKQ